MKNIIASLFVLLITAPIYAQEVEFVPFPVGYTFESTLLIDNQTVMVPEKGGLEFLIHHRFGNVTDGAENLFGIYSTANVRLGLNYGVTERLMIGIGTTRGYKLQDIQGKYQILRQTEGDEMPVSLAYYGNMAIDARTSDNFGPEDTYRSIHRLSYFNQLIVARKFSEKFSFQVAPTLFYFNSVERGYKNLNYGLSAGGRMVFGTGHSIIFEYDQLLNKQEKEEKDPKPQLSIGWEKNTSTHCFQLFFANYSGIVGQHAFMYNQNDFLKGDFLVGLNITVRF